MFAISGEELAGVVAVECLSIQKGVKNLTDEKLAQNFVRFVDDRASLISESSVAMARNKIQLL